MIGPLLLTMAKNIGLEDITMNVELPTFFNGEGKQMGLLTLQSIAHTIIDENLAAREEVEKILEDLKAFTEDDLSIMSLPRIFQVKGRKGSMDERTDG